MDFFPTVNYPYVVVWEALFGHNFTSAYTQSRLSLARKDNAPVSSIYKSGDIWVNIHSILDANIRNEILSAVIRPTENLDELREKLNKAAIVDFSGTRFITNNVAMVILERKRKGHNLLIINVSEPVRQVFYFVETIILSQPTD